jgi:hypothetical protein
MFQFFFNDCIPNSANRQEITECLINSLSEYNDVKKRFPTEVDGIITTAVISCLRINVDNFSLGNCISELADKDLRTFAFRVFSKYPIEKHFSEINEDDLILNNYTITIAGTCHNAINPVIVSGNNGILFTLALHEDLRKNVLTISSDSGENVAVNNLFGVHDNTTYIIDFIKRALAEKLGNWEKLLNLVGTSVVSARFKKGFEQLSSQVQESILNHFEKAINRKGVTPFFADNTLVKDVTPESLRFKLYELRIFKPVPFRVYFYEAPNKIFLGLIEKKPADKTQDNHIDVAASGIEQLLLMEN